MHDHPSLDAQNSASSGDLGGVAAALGEASPAILAAAEPTPIAPENRMSLFIKTLAGDSFEIECAPEWTALQLKGRVHALNPHFNLAHQKLISMSGDSGSAAPAGELANACTVQASGLSSGDELVLYVESPNVNLPPGVTNEASEQTVRCAHAH